jgi:DNA-binding MarR family transcriptional regulator
LKKQTHPPAYRGPNTISRPELLIGGRDEVFRKVLEDLLDFSRRLQEIRQALAERIALSPPQFTILMTMAHSNRAPLTIGDMATAMRVSGPFVVQETNRLSERGLVIKAPDPNDGRRVILQLTDRSKKLLAKIAPVQVQANNALFAGVSRAGLLELGDLIGALSSGCDEGLNKARTTVSSRSSRAPRGTRVTLRSGQRRQSSASH